MGWASEEEWDECFPPLTCFALFPLFFTAASLHQPGSPGRQGHDAGGGVVFAGNQIQGRDFERRLRIFNRRQAEAQRPIGSGREVPPTQASLE